MYAFSYHTIAPFVSHLLSIVVSIFLIAKNPRSKLHITLAAFCLSASLWQLSTGLMFAAQTDELALFWDRVVYVGVNFQWLMHFQFTVLFLKSSLVSSSPPFMRCKAASWRRLQTIGAMMTLRSS